MPSLEEAREQTLHEDKWTMARRVVSDDHPADCPCIRDHLEVSFIHGMGVAEERIAALVDIERILAESQQRVAPLVARERETENIGSLMDFRMKGWSRAGTFAWLVERSAALEQIERALAGQTEEVSNAD